MIRYQRAVDEISNMDSPSIEEFSKNKPMKALKQFHMERYQNKIWLSSLASWTSFLIRIDRSGKQKFARNSVIIPSKWKSHSVSQERIIPPTMMKRDTKVRVFSSSPSRTLVIPHANNGSAALRVLTKAAELMYMAILVKAVPVKWVKKIITRKIKLKFFVIFRPRGGGLVVKPLVKYKNPAILPMKP